MTVMLDNTMLIKVLAGGFGMVCTMVLVLTGKIDGPQALTAVQTITGVFLGSAAVLGGAKAFADAMTTRASANGSSPPSPKA